MRQTFKERLHEAMRIKGKTQTQIAEATGLSKARISQYCSGKYEAKQDGIYLLANALNVSEAWLMGYDVPMERATINAVNNGTAHGCTFAASQNNQNSDVQGIESTILKVVAELSDDGKLDVLQYALQVRQSERASSN